MFRIGFGYDSHRLVHGRPFILGGIRIPHEKGPAGHSDGDALIHAVIDALLGAAGLPDIGNQFPDTDASFKDADSRELLKKTMTLVHHKGWKIGNVDVTVILEEPKLKDHIPGMKQTLALILGTELERISVKAKTNEKMGFVGRGEGLAACAVVLLEKTPVGQNTGAER